MMMFKLFSYAALLAAVSANGNGEAAEAGTDVDCCHPDARIAMVAAGSRCGPVNATDGNPVSPEDFDGSENMQCFVCWDVETNSMDATRPGCSDATDAEGEACLDGHCGAFAAENAHCFDVSDCGDECCSDEGQMRMLEAGQVSKKQNTAPPAFSCLEASARHPISVLSSYRLPSW